jgi:hypothetical protein
LIGERHGDASAALLQSFVGDGVRPVLRRRIKSNRIGVLLHSPARKTSARREPWHYSTSTEDSPVAVDAPWWSEAKGLAGVRSQRMHARFVSQRGAFGTSPKTVFASRRCRGCASLVRLARPRPGAVGPWPPGYVAGGQQSRSSEECRLIQPEGCRSLLQGRLGEHAITSRRSWFAVRRHDRG